MLVWYFDDYLPKSSEEFMTSQKNKRSNNMQQIANFKALEMVTKDLLLRFQGSDARKQTPATQAATALSSIFAPQIRYFCPTNQASREKLP